MQKTALLACSLSLVLAACASTAPRESAGVSESVAAAEAAADTAHEAADQARLMSVIEDPARTAANRARDSYRHPFETLNFFQVRSASQVVEISPGGGWYAEILKPYLAARGTYTASVGKPPAAGFAGPGNADTILTFRNVHNWVAAGTAQTYFDAFFEALKSGGILGVVDHRAAPGTDLETMKKSGYLTEDLVIAYAQKAGFVLEEKSEINANPADTKNHPNGVWTLPPTNRHDAKDDAKYKAIGESDRMTLRFRKP